MNKRKIIIDCDPGIDDSLAIMLALTSPEIEVLGITIVCGNSPVEMGFENAKKILKQMNRLDVPVYMGEPRPLKRDYVNALDTHGADGLGESFLPEVPGYQQEIGAVDFLSKALIKEKVSVIALGPMTNLARLIQKAPAAFDQIEELVSMGGSFKSHGNCSPVAEYNYWCDPDAAALVYDTLHQNGKMIHMIGLDVTRYGIISILFRGSYTSCAKRAAALWDSFSWKRCLYILLLSEYIHRLKNRLFPLVHHRQ